MRWLVLVRPEVEADVRTAASWYDARQAGLGGEFVEEIIRVWDALEENPFLNARKHPRKNLRWRFPERFPFRVIYEIDESERPLSWLRFCTRRVMSAGGGHDVG